ncbi:hypothetical protein K9K83_03680 [Candidatus Woesearchaeota archaeon]|nr:hypothetical protein [Candidatus Woesearchaeota archaeon]
MLIRNKIGRKITNSSSFFSGFITTQQLKKDVDSFFGFERLSTDVELSSIRRLNKMTYSRDLKVGVSQAVA